MVASLIKKIAGMQALPSPRFLMFLTLAVSLMASCAPPAQAENLPPTLAVAQSPTATPFQSGPASGYSPYGTPSNPYFPAGTAVATPELARIPNPAGFHSFSIPVSSTDTNPLTGSTVRDPLLLERRPMAVKVTLFPRYVRPQSGLTLADSVFEYYIEAGLTRFVAIFYGKDAERVGPVRSGRFFDEHVMRMYQSFLVFKFADARVLKHLQRSDLKDYLVTTGFVGCTPFSLGKNEFDSYNNVFFNTTKFQECLERKGMDDNARPSIQSNFFSNTAPQSEQLADRIFTKYSDDDYHYWQYLPEENRYLRYQELNDLRNDKSPAYAPLMDALTGLPVKTDNVVVLFVPHRFANQYDEEDEVFHIDLAGSGKAFVFRDGLVVEATWKRTHIDQPLVFMSKMGMPIPLKPGVTFYQVVGQTSNHWYSGTDWLFQWNWP